MSRPVRRCRKPRVLCALAIACMAAAPCATAQDTTHAGPPLARMDFQDADLRAVIMAIAEAGGLNVTYGEVPARRVTLHLPQGLSRADMLPLLRSVAASNAMRVVEDGNLLRVELANARDPTGGEAVARAAPRAGIQIFVIRLKHAKAPRLAATLQSLYGGRAVDANSPGYSQRVLSDQLRSMQVPPLNIDTIGRSAPSAAMVLSGSVQGEVLIVPDETTNSLLIRAQPGDYETIRQAVEALDLRPLQVLIEVLIAEVRHSTTLDLGVTAVVDRTANGNTTTGSLTSTTPNDFLVRITRGGGVS
ncbi:MAG: gspD, partial [Gemmatimonadetes bacterium]|nr:gspD [Gemmatimonadota bacterium]